MADAPSSYTTNYSIKKWIDGLHPGAVGFNANWDLIDSLIHDVASIASGASSDTDKWSGTAIGLDAATGRASLGLDNIAHIGSGSVSTTEFNYLSGLTGNIQGQLNTLNADRHSHPNIAEINSVDQNLSKLNSVAFAGLTANGDNNGIFAGTDLGFAKKAGQIAQLVAGAGKDFIFSKLNNAVVNAANLVSGTLTELMRLTTAGALIVLGSITSNAAQGTAPFVVNSTTQVINLNADLWDGYQFGDYLNQAVKTTSSPTLNALTVTNGISAKALTLPNLATSTSKYGILLGSSYTTSFAQGSNTSVHFEMFHNTYIGRDAANLPEYKWVNTHASFGSRGIRFDFGNGIAFFADSVATTADAAFTPTRRLLIGNNGNVTIDSGNLTVNGSGQNFLSSSLLIDTKKNAQFIVSSPSTNILQIQSITGSSDQWFQYRGYEHKFLVDGGVEALNISANKNATFSGNLTVNGAGNNYFAGKVGFGTTADATAILNINGNTKQWGDIYSDNWNGVDPYTGYYIGKTGSVFSKITANELHVKAFIADLEMALAGSQIIAPSVAKIYSDFTVGGNLVVEEIPGFTGHVLVDGDYIRLRNQTRNDGGLSVVDIWGTVTYLSRNDTTKTQTYSFTKLAGSGTLAKAGTLALDYGVAGNGIYETVAQGPLGKTPYSQIATYATNPWTDMKIITRMGDFSGVTDAVLGSLTGFGVYTQRLYLSSMGGGSNAITMVADNNTARLTLKTGGNAIFDFNTATSTALLANWVITKDYLYNGNSSYGVLTLKGGTQPSIGLYKDELNNLNIWYTSDINWGITGNVDGGEVFHLGSGTNHIANWAIAQNQISSTLFSLVAGANPYISIGDNNDGKSVTTIGRNLYSGNGIGWNTVNSGIAATDSNADLIFELSSARRVISGFYFDKTKFYKDVDVNNGVRLEASWNGSTGFSGLAVKKNGYDSLMVGDFAMPNLAYSPTDFTSTCIVNQSFESALSTGWTTSISTGSVSRVTSGGIGTPVTPQEGSYFLRTTAESAGSGFAYSFYAQQDLSSPASLSGKHVVVSVQYNTINWSYGGSDAATDYPYLMLALINQNGTIAYKNIFTESGSGWRALTLDALIPSDSTYVRLKISGGSDTSTHYAYWYDIALDNVKISVYDKSYSYITPGSFNFYSGPMNFFKMDSTGRMSMGLSSLTVNGDNVSAYRGEFTGGSTPANPKAGNWYTSGNYVYLYNGTSWLRLVTA